MDGRINIPVATETPIGIMQPYRNLGGRFDLGWPHLCEVLSEHVTSVVREGSSLSGLNICNRPSERTTLAKLLHIPRRRKSS